MSKSMKITAAKKFTAKGPKVSGPPKHKTKPSSPHMKMRHLSPMGQSAFGTSPGESGGAAFPPAGGAPLSGAPPMAFGAGAPDAPGGGAPPVPGM